MRTHRSTRSTLLALTVGGSLALTLGGCGGSGDMVSARPSVTVTAEPAASSATSAGVTSSPTAPTSSAGPGTPRCTAPDVDLTLSDGNGAAGTTYYRLRMTRVYVPDETRSRFVAVDGLLGCRSTDVDLLRLTAYRPVR